MIKTKKSLGQNFLNSREIINDIVVASGVGKDDLVLEIGPGEGILTEGLLSTGSKVITIEKDDRLISPLQRKFAREISLKQLELVHADILDLELPHIANGPYKIVANIPYYITGQIIRMFLESDKQPTSMTILVQKEVAERIVARDLKESLLSISVKIFGEPKLVRVVGRGAFTPHPNVDSALLHIENISKIRLEGVDEKLFFKILHLGFAHKRKQLLPNLSLGYKKEYLLKILEKVGIDPKARAEDLNVSEWIKISKMLESFS